VVTLAFAFAAQSWLFRQSWVTGDASDIMRIEHAHLFGMEIRTVRGVYVIAVVVLALTVVALRSVRRTSVGRAIVAVRDNPALASSYGTSPAAARVMGLAIAGFVTGVAGGLWGMAQQTWSFASFEPSMSFVLLSAAIVGGIGTLHGPILGTIAVFAWPYLVPDANTLPIRAFSSGALLLAVLLFLPGGLAGTLERMRQRLASLLADVAPPVFGPDADSLPLETRDVRRSFGGINAVDGVSITVGAGEIVGLIGANGAGKSTLLSCVSGHLRPDSGLVLVAGQDVTDLAPEFRAYLGVGRTFQDARLFPGLTVIETVMAALDRTERGGAVGAMANAPWLRASERRKRARALEVLSEIGLADHSDTLTSELSTGMRRICDLAAILATSPSLVILDEPTAGLAQREVEAFAPLLRSIRDTHGCALLVVEHDMPLMMELCDRIYCLELGRLIAEGDPAEIQSDERVIASYLGTDTASVRRSGTRSGMRS
jgi:ABC-type branched-subunit amino acid transport system ATPase component